MKTIKLLSLVTAAIIIASCNNHDNKNQCDTALKVTQARLDSCLGIAKDTTEIEAMLTGNCQVDGGSGYRLKDYKIEFTNLNKDSRIVLRKLSNLNDSCSCTLGNNYLYFEIFTQAVSGYRRIKFKTANPIPSGKDTAITFSIGANNAAFDDGMHLNNNSRYAPMGTNTYKWIGTENDRDGVSDWYEVLAQNAGIGFKKHATDLNKVILHINKEQYYKHVNLQDSQIDVHVNPQ